MELQWGIAPPFVFRCRAQSPVNAWSEQVKGVAGDCGEALSLALSLPVLLLLMLRRRRLLLCAMRVLLLLLCAMRVLLLLLLPRQLWRWELMLLLKHVRLLLVLLRVLLRVLLLLILLVEVRWEGLLPARF